MATQLKLMKGTEWAKTYFDESSVPDKRTVHAWVKNEIVPGRIINGVAYVFVNKWESMILSKDSDVADMISKVLNGSKAA